MKSVLNKKTLTTFLVFFAFLAIAESAGFGPAATAAKIRAKL